MVSAFTPTGGTKAAWNEWILHSAFTRATLTDWFASTGGRRLHTNVISAVQWAELTVVNTITHARFKPWFTTHASLIWSYRRRHLRMAAAITMWSSLAHSVLSRCFSSSRSAMHVLYTFSCSIPHTLWLTGFKSGEFWGTVETAVVVAPAWWGFQVSQGSVETLFR